MSPPTAPIDRKAGGAGPDRASLSGMARLLPVLMMVGFTLTMLPNAGCGKGFFSEVSGSSTVTATSTTASTASPSATPTSLALGKQFSLRGSGTQTSSTVGTCTGAGCASSHRNCQCLEFSGTLLSGVLGNSNWTASITVNRDDCPGTGTDGGFCCIGDGTLNVSNGTGTAASLLVLTVTGPICDDPNSSTDPASFDNSLTANFSVLTSANTGKFVNSAGAGQVNILTNGTNAYLSASGEIQ